MSFMKAHQAKIKAMQDKRLLAKADNPSLTPTPSSGLFSAKQQLDLYLDSLAQDQKRLSALNSLEARRALKVTELLPKYQAYVTTFLASNVELDNPICAWVLIWLFDCEQFEEGFELAKTLLAKNITMPEGFSRDIPTFVADAIREWGDAQLKAKHSIEPYIDEVLTLVNDPVGVWQIHEQLRAKLYKIKGLSAYEQGKYLEAVESLTTAQDLWVDVGVKTKLTEAEKKLAKQNTDQPT